MFLAHAFGVRYDLPIPLLLFVIGGAAVVVPSFVLVLPRAVRAANADHASLPDRPGPTTLHWVLTPLDISRPECS